MRERNRPSVLATPEKLFEPDVMTAEQWRVIHTPEGSYTPDERLRQAVVIEALHALEKMGKTRDPVAQTLARQALDWIRDYDGDYVVTFREAIEHGYPKIEKPVEEIAAAIVRAHEVGRVGEISGLRAQFVPRSYHGRDRFRSVRRVA